MSPPRVRIGIPVWCRYDLLARLLRHLAEEPSPTVEFECLIVDNGGQIRDRPEIQALASVPGLPPIEVRAPPYNLGVAGAWNTCLEDGVPCLIANDDVLFRSPDAAAFLAAAETHPDTVIFEASSTNEGFSTFYVARPNRWRELGAFDELFYPAYFEDNDCRYRLALAGRPTRSVALPSWSHDNSSSLAAYDARQTRQHWGAYHRNEAYYSAKWGGPPGHERYRRPFNAGPTTP